MADIQPEYEYFPITEAAKLTGIKRGTILYQATKKYIICYQKGVKYMVAVKDNKLVDVIS